MYLIRLLIVGETGVGKTSLLVRFNENHFIIDQKTTIGVDYKAKEIAIEGDRVKLQVDNTHASCGHLQMNSIFRFGTLQVRKGSVP
jgi:GTPase SAR1 family protein